MSDQIAILTNAIRGIADNWEHGDLAAAVRDAVEAVDDMESNRYWASSEWHIDDVKSAIAGTKYEANLAPSNEALQDYLLKWINNEYFIGEINDTLKENLGELWDSAGFPIKPAQASHAQLEQDGELTLSTSKWCDNCLVNEQPIGATIEVVGSPEECDNSHDPEDDPEPELENPKSPCCGAPTNRTHYQDCPLQPQN